MNKIELPELENLYYSICLMDYYIDLQDKDVVTNKLEIDEHYNFLKRIDIKLIINDKLEKIPIKFSNQEEYIRIFCSLFFIEIKAQLSRSKMIEVIKSKFKIKKTIKLKTFIIHLYHIKIKTERTNRTFFLKLPLIRKKILHVRINQRKKFQFGQLLKRRFDFYFKKSNR